MKFSAQSPEMQKPKHDKILAVNVTKITSQCIMILSDMSLKSNSEKKRYFRHGVIIGMLVTIFVVWDLAGRLGEAVIFVYLAIIGVAGLLALAFLLHQQFISRRVRKPGPGNRLRR